MSISLKELKKNRLTPAEKWLLERIDGVEPKTLLSGNVEWWDKDGVFLFTQNFKNGYLWVNYSIIWSALEEEFGLNYYEIQELIKNVMYDYTNNGSLTPPIVRIIRGMRMYDYTNNGSLTPRFKFLRSIASMYDYTNNGSLTPNNRFDII